MWGDKKMILKAFQIGAVMFCGGFLGTICFSYLNRTPLIAHLLVVNLTSIMVVVIIEIASK